MTVLHFVGPLPPPVHGFSVINEAMLSRLQGAGPVRVFNRAPALRGGDRAHASAQPGASWWRFGHSAWRHRAEGALYLGLSGGWGQLKDWRFLLPARLLGWPVVVHHHSFAYLNPPGAGWRAGLSRVVWRFVLGGLRRAHHVVLCECMGQALSARYGIPPAQVAVLSNAAFLAAEPDPAAVPAPEETTLRVGFLSNITAEKGIWDFLALGDALRSAGVSLQALVAGPVAPDIARRFADELAIRPWCQHLGAVYGPAKAAFFARVDVLAFPTRYANEAEPVTLLEALRAGVPVVATARGCIAEMLPPGVAHVVADPDRFVAEACATLQAWSAGGAAQAAARRQAARAAFATVRARHVAQLERVVAWLTARGHVRLGTAAPWGTA